MSDMTAEDLDRLLALQAVDDDIRRLEHQLAGLGEQRVLDELLQQDATLAEGDVELGQQLDAARREQHQVEGEIEALGQRLAEEQQRLYAGGLATAREIQAVEAEIASTTRRRGEHEDQLLEVMERVEALESRVSELTAVRSALAVRITEATAARDAAAQDLIARIAEVQVRRDPIAQALPHELRERYAEAARRGGGTGVGVLKGGACSACRITFPMSELNDYLTGPPLTSCSQCRRLLIVPE